jgi:hypothetical protein
MKFHKLYEIAHSTFFLNKSLLQILIDREKDASASIGRFIQL